MNARAFYVACHDKRRRPGKTCLGFQKALNALPAAVLRRVATLLGRRLLDRLAGLLKTDGWIVFGCDGSRLRVPRVKELQEHLGDPGGDSSSGQKAPQLWLTALVHLASGVPWSWRVGKGDASERAQRGETDVGDGWKILPNEVGERGLFSDVQTDAEKG